MQGAGSREHVVWRPHNEGMKLTLKFEQAHQTPRSADGEKGKCCLTEAALTEGEHGWGLVSPPPLPPLETRGDGVSWDKMEEMRKQIHGKIHSTPVTYNDRKQWKNPNVYTFAND